MEYWFVLKSPTFQVLKEVMVDTFFRHDTSWPSKRTFWVNADVGYTNKIEYQVLGQTYSLDTQVLFFL